MAEGGMAAGPQLPMRGVVKDRQGFEGRRERSYPPHAAAIAFVLLRDKRLMSECEGVTRPNPTETAGQGRGAPPFPGKGGEKPGAAKSRPTGGAGGGGGGSRRRPHRADGRLARRLRRPPELRSSLARRAGSGLRPPAPRHGCAGGRTLS